MVNMIDKHRHHYIPEGYLKGFSVIGEVTNKNVWTYTKNKYSKPKIRSSRSVAFKNDYYAQEIDNEVYDYNKLENAFSEVENIVIPIIRNLKGNDGKILLSDYDKGQLAFFLALLCTRTPSFRDGIENVYEKIAEIFLDRTMADDAFKKSPLLKIYENNGINIRIKNWISLKPMIDTANELALTMLEKYWQFFTPPVGHSFVTSDVPVVFFGQSPGHPSSIIMVNLRKDLSLFCTPEKYMQDLSVREISDKSVTNINLGIVQSAKEFVFSSVEDEWIQNKVKENIGTFQGVVC